MPPDTTAQSASPLSMGISYVGTDHGPSPKKIARLRAMTDAHKDSMASAVGKPCARGFLCVSWARIFSGPLVSGRLSFLNVRQSCQSIGFSLWPQLFQDKNVRTMKVGIVGSTVAQEVLVFALQDLITAFLRVPQW